MLHYILIFLVYVIFIALVNAHNHGRNNTNVAGLSTVIFLGIAIFVFLTVLYEKILVIILLHNVSSHAGYIAFSAIASGLYMILFFAGLVILADLMGRSFPNIWTIIVFIISLIINIILITKATSIYYDEMIKNFGDHVFENFYESLSKTDRGNTANALLNLKWIVMAVPGVFYLFQLLNTDDYS